MSGVRSVFVVLLLSTTLTRCASRNAVPSRSEAPPNPQAEKAAFEAQGLEAPNTDAREKPGAASLDLAKLAEAFGPATEVSPDQLARLGERRVEQSVAISSVESEDEDRFQEVLRDESESTSAPADDAEAPPADPRRSATDGAEGAAAPMMKESAKKKREHPQGNLVLERPEEEASPGGIEDAPSKTLLPAIERRPTLGKVLVRGPDGKMTALVARAVRVVAHVQGSRARTVVDYVFENPHAQRLEGTFYHPLPADASPAGFAMFDGTHRVRSAAFFESSKLLPPLARGDVPSNRMAAVAPAKGGTVRWGRQQDAVVVEQKRAREVYEQIVRSEVDPALLEWSGGSNFEARVFPIEPKSLKRVVVAYEQPLVFDGEHHRYGYTMPSEATIVERSASFFVDQRHGEIVAAPLSAKRSGRNRRWARFDVANAPSGGELEIAVRAPSPLSVLRGADSSGLGGEAFYAEVRPELPAATDRPTNRAIIMVDTSLSSEEGDAHARRAAMIEALLEKDRSIEQYAVMLFDVRPRWLHHIGWRSNTSDNRAATYRELRRVFLEGATSFASVLDELAAQKSWAIDGAPSTVFLLSDGEITWGLDRVEALPARHPILSDVRWVTYRFGETSANGALFDLLSRSSGGRTVDVLSRADVDAAALAHRRIPVSLESVVVEGAPSVDVVVSGEPRLVFPGQTLRVAGRLPDGGDATLVVTLSSGGSSKAVRVPLPATGDAFAARAWAELQTRRLVARDDPRLDRMIVALSQHYRLANARASFLILENEAQLATYDLKDEQVDLTSLATLEREEADRRRDELLGLGLDGVSDDARQLLVLLRRLCDGMPPLLAPQPLLELPHVGGPERLTSELEYRRAREVEKNDVLVYERIARARALAGDTSGAVRALSSTVELRPRDAEAMRLVGYALLAVAQYDVAVELFERIRLLRPFEAQAYLEEALALDAAGRFAEAARNYEIVLARDFARHDSQSRTTAALHYGRLLKAVGGQMRGPAKAAIDSRWAALAAIAPQLSNEMDFQLTIHWSTDSVDIDLWVFEPSGEKCSYENTTTASGGHLLWDVTDGLGPEIYQAADVAPGPYDTLVHFYGSGAPKMQAPTALLMVVDEAPWAEGGATSRKFLMRMLPKRDAVLMMRTDYFSGS